MLIRQEERHWNMSRNQKSRIHKPVAQESTPLAGNEDPVVKMNSMSKFMEDKGSE